MRQDISDSAAPQPPGAQARRQDHGVPPSAGTSTPVRVPSWAYPLVTVFSLLLGASAIVRGTRAVVSIQDSDLTNFFFKSADYVLQGHPWQMYAVRGSGVGVLATYPNYNPPLSIWLMAPLLALARAVGFAGNYGEQITFVALPFTLFVPLLGYLVVRALRALHPEIPETQQLLAFVLVALSPLTWQSIASWYHVEQPMMLCFLVAALVALQARREGLAGVFAALAVLSRTTALIPLIALGVLLLVGGHWRSLLRFGGIGAALVAIMMAPYFLFDRSNAVYSFISWRGTAQIGGNSIWSVFAYDGQGSTLRHTLDALARRLDMLSVTLFVAAVALVAARRLRVSAYSRDVWAVLSIAALAIPMLSKTNWPYYYLEPFTLLLVWEFSSMHDRRAGVWRWPVLTLGFLAVASTLSQYIGLRSVGTLDRIGVGLLEFGAMAACAVAIWVRMGAVKPGAVTGGAFSGRSAGSQPALALRSPTPTSVPAEPTGWTPVMAPVVPPAPAERPLTGPSLPAEAERGAMGPIPPNSGWTPPTFSTPPPQQAPQSVTPDLTSAASVGWTTGQLPPVPPSGHGRPGALREPPEGRSGAPGQRQRREPLPEQWPDLDAAWPPRPPAASRDDGM